MENTPLESATIASLKEVSGASTNSYSEFRFALNYLIKTVSKIGPAPTLPPSKVQEILGADVIVGNAIANNPSLEFSEFTLSKFEPVRSDLEYLYHSHDKSIFHITHNSNLGSRFLGSACEIVLGNDASDNVNSFISDYLSSSHQLSKLDSSGMDSGNISCKAATEIAKFNCRLALKELSKIEVSNFNSHNPRELFKTIKSISSDDSLSDLASSLIKFQACLEKDYEKNNQKDNVPSSPGS